MKGIAVGALMGVLAGGQDFQQRGYFETRLFVFPQSVVGDSGTSTGDGLFRYEASRKIADWLRIYGALDARTDSHRVTEREWRFDWNDRGYLRPAFSLRRLSVAAHKGPVTLEFGKQLIRWGKADVFNPMDRFAPKDFLNVVDSEFLSVPAARLSVEKGSDTIDLIWQLRFTPSRIPLLNQRWAGAPSYPLRNGRDEFPGGGATGVRWNHVGKGYEYSLAFYDGHNHLPRFSLAYRDGSLEFDRQYSKMRMYGATAAVPTGWFTVKGESGYFARRTRMTDGYFQYVVQLERQVGEWSFVAGYAGEVTKQRADGLAFFFSADHGLAKTFLGRASWTIDPYRSLAFEGAVRQNGDGSWLKSEYSQTFGSHWRALAAFSWIHGVSGDFLGQYNRNSNASLAIRYSF